MDLITSLDNQKIKYLTKLKEKKIRDNENVFLIEGDHLVKEALNCGMLKEIYVLDTSTFTLDVKTYYITEKVMKKVSSMVSIPYVVGLAYKFNPIDYKNRLLLLDNIQDPSNLGTIIRSAKAFNIDTIVLNTNSVDLYNEKVIRSSEGIMFHIDVMRKNLDELIPKLIKNNYMILGTDVTNGIPLKDIKIPKKYAIVIGNEGQGISKNIKELITKNIYIPMSPEVESLNAAVAASIIMYEMSKKDYEWVCMYWAYHKHPWY